jgi:aerobic-type carbon monoxide dehydrogenase small subunit (CoxS/CutS family)
VRESVLRVVVNGEAREATVEARLTLADFLREV